MNPVIKMALDLGFSRHAAGALYALSIENAGAYHEAEHARIARNIGSIMRARVSVEYAGRIEIEAHLDGMLHGDAYYRAMQWRHATLDHVFACADVLQALLYR